MSARHVAVIDIGKTNVKLALVDLRDLSEVAVITRPNKVLDGPPYPHFDVDGAWAFLLDHLALFHTAHRVDAISITTHGAAAALLDANGALAAPILDYEHTGPDTLAPAYNALRPPFDETGAPRLAMGLNVGAQLHYQFETVAGLRDIEADRHLPGIEWQLEVDREEAGRFGANIATIGQVIQLVTNGVLLSEYPPPDPEDQGDIRVRFPVEDRTLDQFAELRLQTEKGLIPIVNFINVSPEPRVSTINRIDGQYVMTVKADVLEQEGYDLNAKIAEIDTWVKAQDWPSGMFFTFRGANEEQAESFSFLMKAMVASLVLMFLVLVTQFNNFYQTALTLMTIILSVFGVLLGMLITGQKFSVIMTGTGVIALAGIVVNNAIVLLDTFNRQIKIQPDRLTAILATAEQRIRPILLTTITTIASTFSPAPLRWVASPQCGGCSCRRRSSPVSPSPRS